MIPAAIFTDISAFLIWKLKTLKEWTEAGHSEKLGRRSFYASGVTTRFNKVTMRIMIHGTIQEKYDTIQ